MADASSPLLQLVLQEGGSHNNNWGDVLNQQLQKIEAAIAGSSSIGVTAGTTALTDDQVRPALLIFTGTLTADVIVQVPARTKGWSVLRNATGNYDITVTVGGGGGYVLPRAPGSLVDLFCDSSSVRRVGGLGQTPVGGKVSHFGASNPDPTTLIPCDGAAISRANYPELFAAIGVLWGAGDGSTTFNVPNVNGRYERGWGDTAVGTYLAGTIQSHTHAASTDAQGSHQHGGTTGADYPDHAHAYTQPIFTQQGYGGAQSLPAATGTQSTGTGGATQRHQHDYTTSFAGAHVHNITVAPTGGSETRPNSYSAMVLIRAK